MTSTLERAAASELGRFWETACAVRGSARAGAESALSGFSLGTVLEYAMDPTGVLLFEAIAAESYHHRNGFSKFTIPGSHGLGDENLRVHIWDDCGDSFVNSDAHDHRWTFSSRVLAGGVEHATYLAHEDPAGKYCRYLHYLDDRHPTGYCLEPVGRATLEMQSRCELVAGTIYGLDENIVHRVGIHSGGYAATLVLEQAEVHNATSVYAHDDSRAPDSPLRSSRCSNGFARPALQKLLAQMSKTRVTHEKNTL